MTLAVIGVVTSVIGAFYYIRIVKVMYFDEPREPSSRCRSAQASCSASSSVVVVLFWLVPAPLVGAPRAAARSLF